MLSFWSSLFILPLDSSVTILYFSFALLNGILMLGFVVFITIVVSISNNILYYPKLETLKANY